MEEFFNFTSFQWKFLGLNFVKFVEFKWKFLQYLIFFMHIIQIMIYGFTRSYSKFAEFIKIDDIISGFQVVIFTGIMLVKYIAIFKNQSEIRKIISFLPMKISGNEKIRFGFIRLLQEALYAFLIYGGFIAFFAFIYLIYMQFNLNFKIVGGLWCPNGSDLVKILFYNWMILLNLAVLTVWIYSEVLKYGLIAVMIVEYKKLREKFTEFAENLKIKTKKKESKKVRFSKFVDFEGRKARLKTMKKSQKKPAEIKINPMNSLHPVNSVSNLNFCISTSIRIIQAPIFENFMFKIGCQQEMDITSGK